MNRNTIEGDLIELSLKQLGATKIEEISSVMYQVEFKLTDELTVSYVYNITHKAKYYLQRIKPYPISRMKFADAREIVAYITRDVRKFANAANSSNFNNFITVTSKVASLTDRIEELFLNYNVDGEDLLRFDKELEDLFDTADSIRRNARELELKVQK